jgi:hypothetical protein
MASPPFHSATSGHSRLDHRERAVVTSELVAFLKTRLDNDEKAARAAAAVRWQDEDDWQDVDPWMALPPAIAIHALRHDAARVLADVEAKRRIIALNDEATTDAQSSDYLVAGPARLLGRAFEPVLRLLALPYAAHPDYRPEWAPNT